MPSKTRPRLIASTSCSTKLFTDDLREVARLSELEKSTVSDLLRELTHEALRARRLRAVGRDEAADFYRQLSREMLQEGLQPLLAQMTQVREALAALPTPSNPSTDTARQPLDERWPRAHFALSVQLLRHLLAAENFGRILTTVGMQRDQLSETEVQAQLTLSDQTAGQDAQQILQQILAEYRLFAAPAGAENHSHRGA